MNFNKKDEGVLLDTPEVNANVPPWWQKAKNQNYETMVCLRCRMVLVKRTPRVASGMIGRLYTPQEIVKASLF